MLNQQLSDILQIRYIKLHFTIVLLTDTILQLTRFLHYGEVWERCCCGQIVSEIEIVKTVILNRNVSCEERCIQNTKLYRDL